MAASATLTSTLKTLGDATRLRILALVEREELSVGELSRALGMSQSRVSNHLRLLREAHLLAERHSGSSTFLRLAADQPASGNGVAAELWTTLRVQVATLPEHAADLARLEALVEEREQRSSEFFDRVARDWDTIGLDFATGQARQRAAAALLPRDLVLADVGCGTGYMARSLVGLCARLVCVDRSPAMLARARVRLERAPCGTELEFRQGELDALPIADAELDGLVAGMVLHHLAELARPLAEMRRVLAPGGTAVLVDLFPHGEEWMQEQLGDRLLGLEPADVLAALERAGFENAVVEPLDDRYQPLSSQATDSSEAERARLALFLIRAHVPG